MCLDGEKLKGFYIVDFVFRVRGGVHNATSSKHEGLLNYQTCQKWTFTDVEHKDSRKCCECSILQTAWRLSAAKGFLPVLADKSDENGVQYLIQFKNLGARCNHLKCKHVREKKHNYSVCHTCIIDDKPSS